MLFFYLEHFSEHRHRYHHRRWCASSSLLILRPISLWWHRFRDDKHTLRSRKISNNFFYLNRRIARAKLKDSQFISSFYFSFFRWLLLFFLVHLKRNIFAFINCTHIKDDSQLSQQQSLRYKKYFSVLSWRREEKICRHKNDKRKKEIKYTSKSQTKRHQEKS